MDTGLETLIHLLSNVRATPELAQGFYCRFYLSLLSDVLAVLTDRCHKSGLKSHAMILHHLFQVAGRGEITVALSDSSTSCIYILLDYRLNMAFECLYPLNMSL